MWLMLSMKQKLKICSLHLKSIQHFVNGPDVASGARLKSATTFALYRRCILKTF